MNKSDYSFAELMTVTGVKPYVLRFWESEFEQIAPLADNDGVKHYSHADIVYVKKIKNLLFEEKLSIPQAKNFIEQELLKASSFVVNDNCEEEDQIVCHKSSLDMMKMALAKDLSETTQVIPKQNMATKSSVEKNRSFNDQDVLNLVQSKKKLSTCLKKINLMIETNNWHIN
ncbi:MAG: MerR family transcriptional regulator [Halobacteriovoraceae bacterium]|jgi:DNA-binding transcriptional MerR regulator|nr:MerR family transcriptional regulator [Halobacteriovoraceae bacterium]